MKRLFLGTIIFASQYAVAMQQENTKESSLPEAVSALAVRLGSEMKALEYGLIGQIFILGGTESAEDKVSTVKRQIIEMISQVENLKKELKQLEQSKSQNPRELKYRKIDFIEEN